LAHCVSPLLNVRILDRKGLDIAGTMLQRRCLLRDLMISVACTQLRQLKWLT
jgi:hypothetical protein